jgi:hypothetical protein
MCKSCHQDDLGHDMELFDFDNATFVTRKITQPRDGTFDDATFLTRKI